MRSICSFISSSWPHDSSMLKLVHMYTMCWPYLQRLRNAMQEVTSREDSESYAKRTITEIETCLGFTFHGAGGAEEEPAEAISNNELEVSDHDC